MKKKKKKKKKKKRWRRGGEGPAVEGSMITKQQG